jgi:phospholipid N-methyltransferase
MTRALLNLLPPDATLLAFEINPRFAQHLRSTITDPRLVLIHARAEALQEELTRRGYRYVDGILSSLALGLMSDRQRHALLSVISICLKKRGIFTQFQYVHSLQFRDRQLTKFDLLRLLELYFRSVQRKIIWPNLPPAFVFTCRRTRTRPSHMPERKKSQRNK